MRFYTFAKHSTYLLFVFFLFCLPAEAKRFSNAYISFELPPNWDCKLEGTEWICTSQFSQRTKEAIIVLTAKAAGPSDSLSSYKAYLQNPRSRPDDQGKSSRVIHVRDRQIHGHPWVDGLHEGSEVGSYYSRYLGTVKERMAILISFSAHKSHYTKYSSDFLKAIESIRVTAGRNTPPHHRTDSGIQSGNETIGAPIGPHLPDFNMDGESLDGKSKDSTSYWKFLILAITLAVVGGILIRKRRKGGSTSKGK